MGDLEASRFRSGIFGPRGAQVRQDASAGDTIASLAAWLTGHRDRIVAEPEPITIGGHDGLLVDIDLAPVMSDDRLVAFGGMPGVPLFANGAGIGEDGVFTLDWQAGTWELGAGFSWDDCLTDPMRIILLDLDGDPLIIQGRLGRPSRPGCLRQGGDADRRVLHVPHLKRACSWPVRQGRSAGACQLIASRHVRLVGRTAILVLGGQARVHG